MRAVRHNYPVSPTDDWAIEETLEYRGRLGRTNRKVTQLTWPLKIIREERHGPAFEQSWQYDGTGRRIAHTLPRCLTTPQNGWQYCNDPADSQPQSHTISTTYDHGLPVRVSTDQGIFAGYQYHPNGQLERADFSNGTYSILDQGTNGMLRPKRIKFYNPTGSLLFQTGTFAYDGAGNITQIGTDRYIYDAASRLVRGTARTASRWEEYTYDPADNITRMVRNGTSIFDYNIDATKNRLIGSAGNPPDIFYDAGGNLTRVGDAANPSIEIEYDGVGMMSRYWKSDPGNGQSEYLYIYGPENYRIVTFDGQTGNGSGSFEIRTAPF